MNEIQLASRSAKMLYDCSTDIITSSFTPVSCERIISKMLDNISNELTQKYKDKQVLYEDVMCTILNVDYGTVYYPKKSIIFHITIVYDKLGTTSFMYGDEEFKVL